MPRALRQDWKAAGSRLPVLWVGSLTQLPGLLVVQCADQPLTMYRWAGRLHDATGSNMWSSRMKSSAYVQ